MIKSKRKTRRGQKSARTGAFSDRSAVGHILSSPFTFFCSRTVFTATPSVSSRRFGYAVLAAAFPALPFPMPRRMFPLCRICRFTSVAPLWDTCRFRLRSLAAGAGFFDVALSGVLYRSVTPFSRPCRRSHCVASGFAVLLWSRRFRLRRFRYRAAFVAGVKIAYISNIERVCARVRYRKIIYIIIT